MDQSYQILKPFDLLSDTDCNEIISRAKAQGLNQSKMGMGINTDIRNNTNTWLEFDQDPYYDIFKKLDYPIDWLYHPYQVSRYKQNQFYDWHTDSLNPKRKSQRVLTLTCCLQPALDAVLRIEHRQFDLKQGQAIIFPSELAHRVDPPSKGERWALTVWAMKKNQIKVDIKP